VQVRTATKNQVLGQLDRAFPGLSGAVRDVLGTKVGRLAAAHFTDPARLAHLGPDRFRGFAARRGVQVNRAVAGQLVAAARAALPTAEAAVARQVLAADLALLADLDTQIGHAEARLAALLPATEYAVLTSVPGWGTVRVAAYAAALGPISRWPAAAKIYRAAGLTPLQYESAGRRRDGGISREGSVPPAPRPARHRPMAPRPGRPNLRRAAARAGQTRWDHRLRPGPPGRQDRIRDGPRPGPLRPGPLELTRTLLHHHRRRWQAKGLEGRIRRRTGYGGPARATPKLAWRPAFRRDGARTMPDDPILRSHTSA
jgi:transposase IS116/IS110/IS902 family protein